MANPVRTTVAAMEPPGAAARARAAAGFGDRDLHDALARDWPCLQTIELTQPAAPPPLPETLRIAAWNIERCKTVEESAALIARHGIDVVLATELDLGMARSGQRHTTRDLAQALGLGYAFAVEFVELGTGDPRETRDFASVANHAGLHGNAILSRWPLEAPCVLPLDDGGDWFVRAPKNDGQHRVGGRMAIAARVAGITMAAAHYESESDPAGRAAQTQRLLSGLADVFAPGPAVIGGDLNTKAFEAPDLTGPGILNDPAAEPSFAAFAAAGFDWRAANIGAVTTRRHPEDPPDKPRWVLDWLMLRDLAARDPFVVPALSPEGAYLSDHDLVGVTVTRP